MHKAYDYADIYEYLLINIHPKLYKIDENARKRAQPILKNLLFMGKNWSFTISSIWRGTHIINILFIIKNGITQKHAILRKN